jgi:hypothetical protein
MTYLEDLPLQTQLSDADLLYVKRMSAAKKSRRITIANAAASETSKGFIERATIAEVLAGTDNARAVTPAGLAAATHNVKYFGAVGDGVTDDTAAIQAFFDALTDNKTGIIPNGTYLLTDTINIKNKSYITLLCNNATIKPKTGTSFANKAVVDMTGLLYSTIQDLKIYCDLASNRPAVGLVVGRTATNAGGGCTFINCHTEGVYTFSSFYDCCAEMNSYINCYFQSETANPAYFSSNKDTAALGCTESTNARKHFYSCAFLNYSGVAGGFAIRLQNGVYEATFDHCFYGIPANGVVFDLIGHAVNGCPQNIFVDEGRVEGAAGVEALFLQNAVTSLTYFQMKGLNWTIASDYMIAINTDTYNCVFDFQLFSMATKYIQVKNATHLMKSEIKGYIEGGIEVDAGGVCAQNICTFLGGYPFSGEGSYEYDGTLNGQTNIIFSTDSIGYDNYISSSSRRMRITVFADLDATPNVQGHELCEAANTLATTITDFINHHPGQVITIAFTTANTTITHGANIKLAGSINVTPTANSTMTFYYDDYWDVWREKSRAIA